jgi:hypothetical protein
MNLLNLYSLIVESKVSEERGLSILTKSNISNPESIIKEFAKGDESKNQKNIPIMAYLYTTGNHNTNNIIDVVNEYNSLEEKKRIKPIQYTKNGLVLGDKTFTDFIRFSEYIHAETSKYQQNDSKGESFSQDFKPEIKPMWSGNNIELYDATSVGKCISYGSGDLTGKSYSFCISQPDISKNMYKSYRDTKESSFYFIVDRNKFKKNSDGTVNLDDPLHIVVFDNTNQGVELTDANNNTGSISEYGSDVDSYISYLKSKGVPVEKMVNKPKTEQEKYEDKLLGRKNEDLKWFANLDNPKNPNYKPPVLESGQTSQNYYKAAYIGRGYVLSNEQFDFLLGEN